MIGMNAATGKRLSGDEHLRQSISDILTTPMGSRVMRRTYGSQLFSLIDQAGNLAGRLKLAAASADAIMRWEPRVTITGCICTIQSSGQVLIDLSGRHKTSGEEFQILGVAV